MSDHEAVVANVAPADTGFRDATPERRSKWWRTVMGEYPTGVCIISALDSAGQPQGLVVGTFSSVSLEPPLVSYMPMRSSRSYTAIAEADRFRVSVLGAAHEDLCRSFASAPPERRFEVGNWLVDEDGIPYLKDAVAWFQCRRSQTIEAGDHDIVIGDVDDLGVGDGSPGMPMLFLKGGFGSFTMPRIEFDADNLGSQLRVADQMRDEVKELAESIPAVVTLCSLAQDRIVVLNASNVQADAPQLLSVGTTFPFAAPLGVVFAAWSGDLRKKLWAKAGHGLDFRDDELLATMLTDARQRGYAASIGPAMAQRFDEVVSNPAKGESELRALWSDIARDYASFGRSDDWSAHVSSIQVPIYVSGGEPNFALVVSALPAGLSAEGLDDIAGRCRAVADRLSVLIEAPGTSD